MDNRKVCLIGGNGRGGLNALDASECSYDDEAENREANLHMISCMCCSDIPKPRLRRVGRITVLATGCLGIGQHSMLFHCGEVKSMNGPD